MTKELQAVPGVKAVEVSLEAGSATVTYDSGKADQKALKEAVKEAGYEVTER